jgi:predicted AAA+ superfamily ATPase
LEWKVNPKRKPLIVRGMRQCGKTWALKDFGTRAYRNLAYLNFDEHPEYQDFFLSDKDPNRIITQLRIALKQPIDPGETLLVFDEIQECPNALASLKYFQENAPQYHVACAGSLLGVRLNTGGSFPVGKVDFLDMFPLTFSEFLRAAGEGALVEYLDSVQRIEPLPQPFVSTLSDYLRLYFVTGGMPEAVAEWFDRADPHKLERVLESILASYQLDFIRHLEATMLRKVSDIWESVPVQLAKENRKFQYNVIKSGASSREYGEALSWLNDARLVRRVSRVRAPGLPLAAQEDPAAFKLYAADIGLLRRLARLDMEAFSQQTGLFSVFKGALAENYVLQSLAAITREPLYYWSVTNPNHEVDFIWQNGADILPLEVKAGTDSRGKGLTAYGRRYREATRLRVRYSLLNLSLSGDVLNIPLFMVDQSVQLIKAALSQQEATGLQE